MMKQQLRILFLTHQGDMAGSTNSISYLTKGLANKGHKVYAGIRRESLLWDLLEDSNVVRIPMTFKHKFDLENIKQIRDAVKEHDIQIINAQSGIDRYTSIFAKKLFKLDSKIIHTRRQMSASVGGPIQSYLYNQGTSGIVAVSNQVANSLIKNGIKKKHIKVIYNGTPKEKYEHINHELTSQLKKKFSIGPQDFVIGCVSRMKNQLQIVQALEKVKSPVKMIFCGISSTDAMNEIIAKDSFKHQVFFEDHVSEKDILSYYGLFDMKVLASTMEGLSQSLLEAMALDTPVLATAYAGNLDLVEDGKNGLLFEDGNIEQLTKQIERLKTDTELRTQLSTEGKKTALEKFMIENTIKNYEEYFLSLVTEN